MYFGREEQIINIKLKIVHLIFSRSDLHSNVTCEASNYNGSVMQKTITLDMNFLPTRISVTERDTPLLAGSPQTFTCTALGSRPPATLTWWLDNKRIDGGQISLSTPHL